MENEHENFRHDLLANNQARCPCCKRMARISKRKIHTSIALMLIKLYHVQFVKPHLGMRPGWIHLEDFKSERTSGNDFSIVKLWGLATPKPAGYEEDKRSSGYWRLTSLGKAFVLGEIRIPRTLEVFDNKVFRKSPETVDIKMALKDNFSYYETYVHI